MAAPAVLANPHASERWSTPDLSSLDLAGDPELAEFVAAAPKMARALNAILRLDLDQEAERLIRSEIRAALG
ncbi:hypothetical protein Achl_4032 (plasmid) [Pseudarthrobacter chlorophenolicus A6]|uniref:Uncharacterized protein n=1 Tax=Pseudarthrobacter chlorophenolicus (strain ATCC 700700 / DSM 12829 / CIP 107037 / JCM 12360 / KCTC 9906 / NCIMB 13794 / A6) TaxID=452863 RepID=B8HHT6_PSECP|nr:hypothetical protein [Pseudarthrobacter chlorophenolicus]ACL41983.1 hypothetical protein Achl_4032 [Pseudarthrobacter chlorophenolicus A6]SDQ19852.1 hypothetical protein SAMN04489738_0683 [Pseudarthrobacter chlorophenolicus]